jgi:hypothetical protein
MARLSTPSQCQIRHAKRTSAVNAAKAVNILSY